MEKKSIKISLSTLLLIIAIIIMVGMAYYIYIEKTSTNKEIADLESNIEKMQKNTMDLQDEMLNTNNNNYEKYIGIWNDDHDEFEIKEVDNDRVTFEWRLHRLAWVESTLSFTNNKAVFYFEGYDNKNFDDNLTQDEKYMRKVTIEIKDDFINITVEAVDKIDEKSTILDFDGSVYVEEGIYKYKRNIDNTSSSNEKQFSDNEVKEAFQNYLDLIAAEQSSPLVLLVEIGLCEYSDYENVARTSDNFVKTDIKYSTYKEKMLNYITEEWFETRFMNFYREQDGILYYLDGGASGLLFELEDITLKGDYSDSSYIAKVYLINEDDSKELKNIEFHISNYNGKCVISYCD